MSEQSSQTSAVGDERPSVSERRLGDNPREPSWRCDSPTREAEGRPATKNVAWSNGRSDPGRRPLVRHSLGPDDPQHGFNG